MDHMDRLSLAAKTAGNPAEAQAHKIFSLLCLGQCSISTPRRCTDWMQKKQELRHISLCYFLRPGSGPKSHAETLPAVMPLAPCRLKTTTCCRRSDQRQVNELRPFQDLQSPSGSHIVLLCTLVVQLPQG